MPYRPSALTLGAIAIAIVTLLRIAATWNVFSETNDEPMHVSCGLQIYELHQYDYQTVNPPLPRLFIALGPRLLGAHLPPHMPLPGMMKMFYTADYPATLIAARAGTLVFVLIALAAAWAWARREAGELTAFVTVLLLAGEPLFLGHGGLATHDAAAAAGMAVALLAFSRWLERPSAKNAALLGAAYGFATLCKFSCLVFVPVACTAILLLRALRHRAPRLREIGAALAVVAVSAFFVIWAGYGFTVGTVMPMGFVHEIVSYQPFLTWHITAPRFLDGIAMVRHYDREGMTSYLHGHLSTHGWWYYFPVAVALKTTLPLLALAIAGIVVARRTPLFVEAIVAVAAMLAITFTSTLDIGARYVLPIYVPLAFAGAVAATTMLARSRAWRAAAIALVVAHVAVSALAHPDYLAYFNAVAGNNPSRWLIDSNIEWGQDAKRLAATARALHIDHLKHAVMVIADLDVLGFPPREDLDPGRETHGWIAVGEHFYRLSKASLGGRLWLDGRPYRRVGKSIRLYYVP